MKISTEESNMKVLMVNFVAFDFEKSNLKDIWLDVSCSFLSVSSTDGEFLSNSISYIQLQSFDERNSIEKILVSEKTYKINFLIDKMIPLYISCEPTDISLSHS